MISKSFSQVAKKVLSGENKGTYTVSLAFVTKAEMQKLNNKFRKKNKPTDVLSFELSEPNYLGEVVICKEVVKEKGENLMEVFIHGVLHLCGYDHERSPGRSKGEAEKEAKVMEEKQAKYLAEQK